MSLSKNILSLTVVAFLLTIGVFSRGSLAAEAQSSTGSQKDGGVDVAEGKAAEDTETVSLQGGVKESRWLDGIFSGFLGGGDSLTRIFPFARRPWWQGENVCVDREEKVEKSDDGKNQTDEATELVAGGSRLSYFGIATIKTCRSLPHKHICTDVEHNGGEIRMVTKVYKCCPGSRRNLEKDSCEAVEVKSAADTARSLGATRFADMMDTTVKKSVMEKSNVTIFVPTDKAVEAFWKHIAGKRQNAAYESLAKESEVEGTADANSENEIPLSDKQDASSQKSFDAERSLSHIVEGVHDIHDLDNEQILRTVDGLPIRINVYLGERKPTMTANCALIKSANHPVMNDGLLHTVDAVMPIAKKTIKQIVSEAPELNSFKNLLEKAGVLDELGEDGNYTVFAPNEQAVAEAYKEHKFLQNGKKCLETVVKTHIVPRTLCSSAFRNMRAMTRSTSGTWLTMEKDENNNIVVARDSKTIVADIVASNGVIHVVSKVIVPPSAAPVDELLEERNHTRWLKLIEKAGLREELEQRMDNRTIFVPSEDALAAAETELESYDTEKLKDIVRFHISDQSVCTCQMQDDMMLPSLLPDKTLRVNTYATENLLLDLDPTVTVQCGALLRRDEKACNFMVHEVDRLLKPATQSVLEIIRTGNEYTTLRDVLKGTEVEKELEEGKMQSITFLAPTNEAFGNLTKEEMEKLQNKTVADQLLRRHILNGVICCNGIGVNRLLPRSPLFSEEVVTASGTSLYAHRRRDGQVSFGAATTVQCDNIANNGLVHSVDKVMMPRPISLSGTAVRYYAPDGSEIVLFGI